ncbi:muconate/chloromuconate family cycloisomerase [Thioclava sp. GXIMD2076]|uniref:Muconate/chloromuconate family cycloisomerase n=1 Tax=Thioclava kandeliae TaxID=3070818 RepID=A0ABV1SME0_9RHOB
MVTIDKITTRILDIPTIRGHVLSVTTMLSQALVLVEMRFSDGSVGIGEGTTIGGLNYCAESPESIRSAIDTYLAPALIGLDADNLNAARVLMEKVAKGNPIAHCALEMALWDGFARRRDMAVHEMLGGAQHKALPCAWTLASGNSEMDIAEAEEMLATRRHRIFKLKIGKRDVAGDVAHVAAIARAVGDRGEVRVDVNQAWSLQDARYGCRALQEAGVTLIEQPLRMTDVEGMAKLTEGFEVAIMADEVLQGPLDAMRVARAGAADVFAIKIGQSGGLLRASEVMSIAQAAGIALYGGTMLEAGVSTAAAMQLFSTVEQMRWGTELFGPLLLTDEILQTPIEYKDFMIHLPQGKGLGVDLDPEQVAKYDRDNGRTALRVSG